MDKSGPDNEDNWVVIEKGDFFHIITQAIVVKISVKLFCIIQDVQ